MNPIALATLLTLTVGSLETDVARDYRYLEQLYQDLHEHPELSFEEKETAARVAREMESLGFTVTRNVGGHGVVSVLKNGRGPTVMLRTDLDGLPVNEQTGLSYASKNPEVMHACAHDIHMTVFVGTARRLVDRKKEWSGTLVMIAQPAEERGAGAKAMLADGLFTRFPRPDYNLALHVSASLPAGTVAYVPGFALANVDSVDITVRGVGGHGAYPHTTKDPIVVAARIVTGLQTIVAREIDPRDPAVITVGSFHGGTKHNVIPAEVKLQLTVRSYSSETRDKLLKAIERMAVNTARSAAIPDELLPIVQVKDEHTPATYNEPALTKRIAAVLSKRLGKQNVVQTQPVMGGEDFGRYGGVEPKIPSLMLWLGAVPPKKVKAAERSGESLPSLHSAFFAPEPSATIQTGVRTMTVSALELFGR